ncbi:MAG: phytanoyl-CoA dioxygenase family protein [Ectothiorhodospiraceae bacterium]|nr:phytanoyl-CoA dioxygenase family protein [Chromatiales bacterium]MCP5157039.1 phytanoyl-CoA dioxygenase family protein [Ectothiorhodospiraceae bacterium]
MQIERVAADEVSAHYREHGFAVPRYRLPPTRLAALQALAARLIDDNRHLGDQPMVCPHVPGGGVQGLKGDRAWLAISLEPAILDLVESVVGPDIILWGTNLFAKPAGVGRRVPFHRDGRYWPIEPLASVTVWIAVERCDAENGCLRVVPGSHRARAVGTHYTSQRPEDLIPETLDPREYDAGSAVDVVLEAGEMVLFDVYTIHGSNPNTSDRRRIGYAMRYMPSTSRFVHDAAERRDQPSSAHHTRPLFLVRGTDRCGANDFRTGHPEGSLGLPPYSE